MKIIKEGFASTNLDVNAKPIENNDEFIRSIRECIISENDAANMYEKLINSIVDSNGYTINSPYEKAVIAIRDIANEEKKHIGEFTKILSMIDYDDIENYKLGVKEV